MSVGNENIVLARGIELAADESASEIVVLKADRRLMVKAFKVASKAAIAADGANSQELALMNGALEVSTVSTAAGFVAGVPLEGSEPDAGAKIVEEGDVLTVESTVTGAGKAVAGCLIQVEYQYIR